MTEIVSDEEKLKTYKDLVASLYHITFDIGKQTRKIGLRVDCMSTSNKRAEEYEKEHLNPECCIFYLLKEIHYQLRETNGSLANIIERLG